MLLLGKATGVERLGRVRLRIALTTASRACIIFRRYCKSVVPCWFRFATNTTLPSAKHELQSSAAAALRKLKHPSSSRKLRLQLGRGFILEIALKLGLNLHRNLTVQSEASLQSLGEAVALHCLGAQTGEREQFRGWGIIAALATLHPVVACDCVTCISLGVNNPKFRSNRLRRQG
jgi:hypothetical protein